MRGPGMPSQEGLEIDLKSPGLVAAVIAATPSLRPPHYPPRETVRRKRELFERGMSEPLLRINKSQVKKLERGRSYDLLKHRRENEAQRLVKYRSASSLASLDSGFGFSRSGSVTDSTEDLRPHLTRSVSHDRLVRRKSAENQTSKYLTRSATTNLLGFIHNNNHQSHSSYNSNNRDFTSPTSDFTLSSPDLTLPDLLPSPPPLPPKKRPPLPPRKKSQDPPPVPKPPSYWDFESDISGHTSDASLPEYLVDDEGCDSFESSNPSQVKGQIPETFPFKHPLQKFLAELGQTLSTEIVIKNVYGGTPGYLDVTAHTVPCPSSKRDQSPRPSNNSFSLPQRSEPVRPASLSSGTYSPVCSAEDRTALGKKYRTELQIFFRTGTISSLEEQRDLVLSETITKFQAHCRGCLARKRLEKRKIQETAIRCIQKNVRKFMGVREWPWWRLLVRVTPLLNVHRTEEELRITKNELESLKTKLEKSEKERSFLKHENERLDARLSEATADLSEEQSTAQLAGERLEAEQAERMKLEKEINILQTDVKRMTSENGKLEMERLALRNEMLHTEMNGVAVEDEAAEASLYKRKYEWSLREMELLKTQLKQQQEDDLDQLLLLKKQMEKKVSDAYEETDEQRQIVAQLKRKCQRVQAEMNDLKILLEEQTSRNNLLEKKQRKFDQDMQGVHEELRTERLSKEKTQRERDQILSEKYSFEQEVAALKLEVELKDEKVSSLRRELDDLTFTGKAEEEVAALKKAKHDLELRVKDQEEELDDLAGQVQMLEAAKVRLEMSIEQTRKENRRESSQRDEELEEVRIAAQKKIKSLEAQLENEHEERTQLVREKHELERRVVEAMDRNISTVDEESHHRLKKELKKTKALLKDTQTMLEKTQSEGSNKLMLRQLKTQLEDAEFAKTAAIKARQSADADLSDIQAQLDEVLRNKKDAEDRCARMTKEKAELQTQLEESEEEVAEVMKKYKATVSQLSVDQITLSEQSHYIAELEHDKQVLQERQAELSSKVEVLEGETANIHTQRRLEMKIKEMESKLELEQTTRQRLESQITRLKDQVERLSNEVDAARHKETQAMDHSKKLSRQLREAKEDHSNMLQKHTDATNKKQEIEKQLELSEAEIITLKSDLKLAFKRIEDLQQALQGDVSDSDSDISDSDSDSDTSLSSYLTASIRNQRSTSNSTLRTPPSEIILDRGESGLSPGSEAMSVISEDLEENPPTPPATSPPAESFA